MTTDVFTVHEDDPVELVLSVMHWRRIRHIPVEDNTHNLKGLVDYRSLIELFQVNSQKNSASLPVHSIMTRNVPTATPGMTTLTAIALMTQKGVTCLPVVQGGKLVGIVTQNDFMRIAAKFLELGLGSGPSSPA
jgi:CBS domain-containing protein